VLSEREAAPVPGTTIEVRDLFFNTPARLKFLKSDNSEKSHLARVVEEAALAYPETSFVYKSENRKVLEFASRTSGDFRPRIAEVLGDESADGMLEAAEERGGIRLRAYFSPANALGPSRN